MISEIATGFPKALASTSEARRTAERDPEMVTEVYAKPQTASDVQELVPGLAMQIVEISDELLLKQIQQGERDALAVLFRRHGRTVRNVAYRILRNDAGVDDLVQDIFIFLFRKSALFAVRRAPGSCRLPIVVPSTAAAISTPGISTPAGNSPRSHRT
jgi:RNA polymerase sigma-70 factor (ECF subfamily)